MSNRVGGVRTPYNYDVDLVSRETGLLCADATRTQQQFKEECDINTIIERFGLAAQVPEGFAMPLYGDFTEADDYHAAMNLLAASNEAFEELPANIRERFANDPGKLMMFMSDESNREEAIKLNLIRPTETTPPVVPVSLAPREPLSPQAPAVAVPPTST